ncbi:hypothetical protein RJT34_27744 [Clitoria ternatea]|uniref:Uncharacterized protein n=1 Tax=Clitoria ternatea TaxID=43366 RepID=A0AAN9IGH4_CLITE
MGVQTPHHTPRVLRSYIHYQLTLEGRMIMDQRLDVGRVRERVETRQGTTGLHFGKSKKALNPHYFLHQKGRKLIIVGALLSICCIVKASVMSYAYVMVLMIENDHVDVIHSFCGRLN